MGKTYRKDGSNRNKHFVKNKKGNLRKFNKNDYERLINEYERDNEYAKKQNW